MKKLNQIIVLDNAKYLVALNDKTGYYSPESVKSFDDFVNFEMTVLNDREEVSNIVSVTPIPLNGKISVVVVYNINN